VRSCALAAFAYGTGLLATAGCLPPTVCGADWPQAGFDAGHTAASPEALPPHLYLHWTRDLPRLKPAWPDQPRMDFDVVYRPLIVGGRLVVASPADDSLAVYDLADGRECWRRFTGGPIRLPPASDGRRVFAGSDDGWLYAFGVERGELLWKVKAAPKSRPVLGHGRLIDTWCVRGGPVVADGQVCFAAGIWPFMGIFIQCLDAATGHVAWSDSADGAAFTIQPHGSLSFGGIAPQGTLAVCGPYLLVPGGRTLPACYDRHSGARRYFHLAGKAGNHQVTASGHCFFCDGTAYELSSGQAVGLAPPNHVLSGDRLYALSGNAIVGSAISALGGGGHAAHAMGLLPLAEGTCLIQAGQHLYAGGKGGLAAVDLPLSAGRAPAWQVAVEGTVAALAAGGQHLAAVSEEGRIYCFGPGPAEVTAHLLPPSPPPPEAASRRAEALLRDSATDAGYALLLGAGSADLARALVARSDLHAIVLEPDEGKAQALRVSLHGMGLYGERIAVWVGELASAGLPPYFASLVVSEQPGLLPAAGTWCAPLLAVLHPYHGKAYLKLSDPERKALERAATARDAGRASLGSALGLVRVARSGGLPGAGNWTHEHADAANTRCSPDTLVKAPLGLLWFGGSSHDGILPRHGHGPQPQVRDGRLVIEKVEGLRAVDIYTGRILWEAAIPGLGGFYNNTSHQFGANGTGANYIFGPDAIYVRYFGECLRLDPASGKPRPSFPLPESLARAAGAFWGYLNVVDDYLVGGVAVGKPNAAHADDEAPQAIESQTLFVMRRGAGKLLWSATAKNGFRHNAICAGGGMLFAIDRSSSHATHGLMLGRPSASGRLVAMDLATGKIRWQAEQGVFGTWLSYSAKHGVLVESGYCGADNMWDEPRGMRAYHAADGRELWYDAQVAGPPLIHGDWILRAQGGCGILDGKPIRIADPLTGAQREWSWTRGHGCNTPAASEHLLTFRSGAAGYYDLARIGGTGNWGGFRSSCTNNLIVAGGLLTAPDYTRTCTCSYQNQTSLALVPDPEAEMWTYGQGAADPQGPVCRWGINFGGPGNRVDDGGTLWTEYPNLTGGSPPPIRVASDPAQATFFCRHASTVSGPLPWVCASGAVGLRSVAVTLGGQSAGSRTYTVKLYFAEPDDLRPGQRSMRIALQGKEVLDDFDVVREAGGPRRAVVKQFSGIVVKDQLVVTLSPRGSRPTLLCGLEIIAQSAPNAYAGLARQKSSR
jgi:outer membrane protein assembly factor BamB